MIKVQVDQNEIKQLYQKAINNRIKELDSEMVYWDSNELKRRTCMCWNTIQNNFFFDNHFPKIKIGGKWYFPAEETKQFLKEWLMER